MSLSLSSPVRELKGVGAQLESVLNRLGIYEIRDLLEYYPRDYEESTGAVSVRQAVEDKQGEKVTLRLRVATNVVERFVKGYRFISCDGSDDTGSIVISWVNQPYIKNVIKCGGIYYFRGTLRQKGSHFQLSNPKILSQKQYEEMSSGMVGIYPLTRGLSMNVLQKLMRQALTAVAPECDHLNKDLCEGGWLYGRDLCDLKTAYYNIHFASGRNEMLRARRRLVFDEFLAFTLNVRMLKSEEREKSSVLLKRRGLSDRLISLLPYELTDAQKRTVEEIYADVSGPYTMNRLIQGDVGCGKTIVAFCALLFAVENGYQASMMAPTEVLARQHYEQLRELMEKLGLEREQCVYLAGSLTEKEKRKARERIGSGEARIVIGTHALIQDSVTFKEPGLVVTDEQHRFGVKQRMRLSGSGQDMVHTLVMSATPIPRTLAVILYGDLDISLIDELPKSRLPIKNCVVGPEFRKKSYEFIDARVKEGRQALVICPMVEHSDSIEAENVIEYGEKLKSCLGGGVRVEILHGRMKGSEKNEIMERFLKDEIDVLVSTTVVEVGVNVPNTTVMLVENCERFGLSQLHQLRGRVGRGIHQSYCIFMCSGKGKQARERLEILNRSNDGFKIAEEDLRQRGPGDIFGFRQSGDLAFKIGDIYTDAAILKLAADYASHIAENGGVKEYNSRLYDIMTKRSMVFESTVVL